MYNIGRVGGVQEIDAEMKTSGSEEESVMHKCFGEWCSAVVLQKHESHCSRVG